MKTESRPSNAPKSTVSKADLARQMFATMSRFPRSVVMNRYVAELGMTTQAASTYYHNVSNEKPPATA